MTLKLIGLSIEFQFLSNRSRPDISNSVGILSQYAAEPTNLVVKAFNQVFGYLKGTRVFNSVHAKQYEEIVLSLSSESDYARDLSNMKSCFSWVGELNDCVSSEPKKTYLSTPNAEAEDTSMNCCEIVVERISQFLAEIGLYMSDYKITVSFLK